MLLGGLPVVLVVGLLVLNFNVPDKKEVLPDVPEAYQASLSGEYVLTLGEPQDFGDYKVTLIDVSPAKTQAEIPESSYGFTFEIINQKKVHS